jgi:hypothetical protein
MAIGPGRAPTRGHNGLTQQPPKVPAHDASGVAGRVGVRRLGSGAVTDVVIDEGRTVEACPGLDGDEMVHCSGHALLSAFIDSHVRVVDEAGTVEDRDEP